MGRAKLNLNAIGWANIGIVIGWTSVLSAVMVFLWHHRRLPHLQMRRLPLVFLSITLLHLYASMCMIFYVILPVAPCAAEYWIMSIFVPFGVALFQVANSQFLHIAGQQRRFTNAQSLEELVRSGAARKASALDGQSGSLWQRTQRRLKNVDQLTRMVIFICVGMLVQASLAVLIFLMSRKFHPGFGVLPANLFGTDAEQRMQCSRGWEWWLSIVWQFFWAWLYAPYILWRSRNIQDTHGWRIQTILCCVAGLPCSPLWLCGLYLPQFTQVNSVFIPPQWFAISIFFIECFTLLIPCYQVFKHHTLKKETLAAIVAWEAKTKAFATIDSNSTKTDSSTQRSFKTCSDSEKGLILTETRKSLANGSVNSRKTHMYTMVALEHALNWNAALLQNFAALKDFSGENISFLTHLQRWKKALGQQQGERFNCRLPGERETEKQTEQDIRSHFNCALRIYAAFVSAEHAEFPINISSKTLRVLDDMFAGPAELLFGDTRSESTYNSATPFNDVDKSGARVNIALESGNPRPSDDTIESDHVWYWGEVPSMFGANVFDESEAEIKYLVLTNTWPKFVNAGLAEQIEDADGKSLSKKLSQLFHRSCGEKL